LESLLLFVGGLACACRQFDKDNIDPAIMKKIQTYTPLPDFQPEKIEKASPHSITHPVPASLQCK